MYAATFSFYVTIRPWPLTYDLGIFLSSWWSFVLSCTILQLTVHSVSCLQRFPIMWRWDIGLWTLTLKKIGIFLWSCWWSVPSCKTLKLTVWPTKPEQTEGQTDGRRKTIIRPFKDGRIRTVDKGFVKNAFKPVHISKSIINTLDPWISVLTKTCKQK